MFNTSRISYTPHLLATLMLMVLAALIMRRAAAQTPATTIEDADGTRLLQLNGDGGFALFGTYDPSVVAGTIPAEDEGARLMWYPGKAAFRAGYVTGTQWDDGNVGMLSTAMGHDATASGLASTAVGLYTTASGNISTAMGNNTTASGDASTAMGWHTTASGDHSTAMGWETTAATNHSLSVGRWNDANQTSDGTLFVVGNGSFDIQSDALVLDENGNLTIAGSLTESSDRRLKTAIAPLEAGTLERLAAIRPVRYRFRDTTRHPAGAQIGLIAQEVQQQFPELVSEGSGGYLSLSYSKLTAVLVKGFQELESENEALRTEVDTLRERLDHMTQLEGRLAALEAGPPNRQRAGWAWPAGMLLGLVLAGGLAWWRRA